MTKKRRLGAVLGLVGTTTLLASAWFSSNSGTNTKSTNALYTNPAALNWWQDANQAGPSKTYGQKVADDFHAPHPSVTMKISAIETNDPQSNKIPAALLSRHPPDIFQAWGGGEIEHSEGTTVIRPFATKLGSSSAAPWGRFAKATR